MKKKTTAQAINNPMFDVSVISNNAVPRISLPLKYVVIRDEYRVSDKEYEDPKDPSAINELQFWTRISKNHSHGESVKIVIYDSKIHRVW